MYLYTKEILWVLCVSYLNSSGKNWKLSTGKCVLSKPRRDTIRNEKRREHFYFIHIITCYTLSYFLVMSAFSIREEAVLFQMWCSLALDLKQAAWINQWTDNTWSYWFCSHLILREYQVDVIRYQFDNRGLLMTPEVWTLQQCVMFFYWQNKKFSQWLSRHSLELSAVASDLNCTFSVSRMSSVLTSGRSFYSHYSTQALYLGFLTYITHFIKVNCVFAAVWQICCYH